MIKIHVYSELIPGTLLLRYKRFLVDVDIPGKGKVTAFCPNSGSMKGCSGPGSPVMLSPSLNPVRKTGYTLEMVHADGVWISVNTLLTNHLAHRVIDLKLIRNFPYHVVQREVKFHDSRLDFLLSDGKRKCYVEVKSITLRKAAGEARFPDAVTTRGTKHLHALIQAIKKGHRACILYIIQRSDCHCFAPAEDIDPEYAKALRLAVQKGVMAIAFMLDVKPEGIYALKSLPLCRPDPV